MPRHDVFKEVANEAARRVLKDDKIGGTAKANPAVTLEATGPGVLTDAVAAYLKTGGGDEVIVHDVLVLRENFVHNSQHTWREKDSLAMFRPGGKAARNGSMALLAACALAMCFGLYRLAAYCFLGGAPSSRRRTLLPSAMTGRGAAVGYGAGAAAKRRLAAARR